MSREQLANDIWRACDIMRRDNNCGGVMEYVEHLAWLLFFKFLDEQEAIFETEAALSQRQYTRIISTHIAGRSGSPKLWDQARGERAPYCPRVGRGAAHALHPWGATAPPGLSVWFARTRHYRRCLQRPQCHCLCLAL